MADNFAKINEGVSYKGQGTTPSNLSDGDIWYDNTAGFQIRNLGSTKSLPGSGGGGGINFVGMSSTWAVATQDDRDAETSVGNWVTYADAAGTLPVDMTGGTASQLTFSRTTTAGEILDGAASFKVVKSAANAQGQGISCLINVPPGYQGKTAQISIPFKVVSGTLVENDVNFFVYDVTNSSLITPSFNQVVGTQGTLKAVFPVPGPATTPANLQLRIGFHFASTVTTAVTIAWDDVSVSPEVIPQGAIVTDWQSYTPSFNGFGTCTSIAMYYRRFGDSLEVQGRFTTGTTTASEGRIYLPNNLTIDSTKITTNDYCGILYPNYSSVPFSNLIASTGNNYVIYDRVDGSNAGMVADNGSNGIGNTSLISVKFSVPIQGWVSNTTLSNSSTFFISNMLVNGTRVTSTPTQLGEYRALYRASSSSNAFSDVSSVATPPSSANGIFISSTAYASTGTNSIPERYEIFVGKNKSVFLLSYSSTGRTGSFDLDYHMGSNSESGALYSYDPVAGVCIVDTSICIQGATTVSRYTGRTIATAGPGAPTSGYFDIQVSENALAVGVQAPRSEIRSDTTNGWGSSSTKIRKFTTSTILGTAISLNASATLGYVYTINENGLYGMSGSDVFSTGTNTGISLNSSQLTTNFNSITATDRLTIASSGNGEYVTYAVTKYLQAGDVIRVHGEGAGSSNTDGFFIITKLNN